MSTEEEWYADADGQFDKLRTDLNKDLAEMKPPSLLHQYTTTHAAKAIIERGRVWASDVRFMNDPTEWIHGHDVFAADFKRRIERGGLASDVRGVLTNISEWIQQGVKDGGDEEPFQVMIASFCQDHNDLALWRPYGDDGAGCCVGIDFSEVPDHPKPGVGGNPIIYDDTTKAERTKKAVTEHLKLRDKLFAEGEQKGIDAKVLGAGLHRMLKVSLKIEASTLATAFKHPAYASEKEWRLVVMFPKKESRALYRVSKTGVLVPYVELDVERAIKRVVLGPRHPAGAVEPWKAWLKSIGKEHIEVLSSEAPYRLT